MSTDTGPEHRCKALAVLVVERDARGSGAVDDRCGTARAGDRDADGRERQQPGEHDLLRRDAVALGDLAHTRVTFGDGPGTAASAERGPGQERDAELGAPSELRDRRREVGRQLVLHRCDVDDRARLVELLDRDVGDADEANDAVVTELLQRADGTRGTRRGGTPVGRR
jgi:hypothetical protein